MRAISFLLLLFLFLVGCNQKNTARDAEKEKQNAIAKAKQEKIDKAKKELFKEIKEKRTIFEKTVVAKIQSKDGKRVFENCEIYEWSPNKLTLYSKDGSLDSILFSELNEETREELGFDKRLYSLHKSYQAYVKRNTISGGTAGISVNRKKTDTDLRKDAEAATSEEIVRYTYKDYEYRNNNIYSVKFYLMTISVNNVVRINNIRTITMQGKPNLPGSPPPKSYNTRASGRRDRAEKFYNYTISLWNGQNHHYKSKSAAVESRYKALKFRNR